MTGRKKAALAVTAAAILCIAAASLNFITGLAVVDQGGRSASSTTFRMRASVGGPVVGNASSPNYGLRVRSVTRSGVDLSAPSVVSTGIADNATGIDVSTSIVITFNEPMDALTTGAAVSLRAAGATQDVTGTASLSADGMTLTFTPDGDLEPETVYTVTLAGTAEDATGNLLGVDEVFTFTTGTSLAQSLIGTGCLPAGGGTGAALLAILLAAGAAVRRHWGETR